LDSRWLTDVAHHHLAGCTRVLSCRPPNRTPFSVRGGVGYCEFIWHGYMWCLWAYTAGAPSLDAFTVHAYLTKDFTAMSAMYTHHEYIGGFFLLGALYLIGEFRYSVPHMLSYRWLSA